MGDARKIAAALVIINHYKKKKGQKVKRQWWIKELYRQRNDHFKEILSDMTFEGVEDTIQNFIRMNSETFDGLCMKLHPIIGKKDTSFRKAITTRERLAITLRYLATGDSFVSLQYLFKVSKQSISKIVRETCDGLVEVLNEYVQVCFSNYPLFIVNNYKLQICVGDSSKLPTAFCGGAEVWFCPYS